MLIDASAGILHCHAKHVIHRDISARNFLVDPFHRVTVCDFGMSRFLPPGESLGRSPDGDHEALPIAWCAPETLLEHQLSESTDVYAFGVLMNEVSTRTSDPFGSRAHQLSVFELAEQIARHGWRPEIVSHCPQTWAMLMEQCWQAQPTKRPSMQYLHGSLQTMHAAYTQALGRYTSDMKGGGANPDQALAVLRQCYTPVGSGTTLPSTKRVDSSTLDSDSISERERYAVYSAPMLKDDDISDSYSRNASLKSRPQTKGFYRMDDGDSSYVSLTRFN